MCPEGGLDLVPADAVAVILDADRLDALPADAVALNPNHYVPRLGIDPDPDQFDDRAQWV